VIVLDASVLVDVLLRVRGTEAIKPRLLAAERLHAPNLIDLEVAQVARRRVAFREMSVERGDEMIADLVDFPLRRYRHDFLLPRVWTLRNNLSTYDAVYVALAEMLEAPLLTRDKRLAGAAGHHATIELV
jgi:predicted nucleic acid-binding protein